MIKNTDAVVALPGGSGTLDELLEAISWKRLGMYTKPIIIVNVKGFYDPLLELLDKIIQHKFMDERHKNIWTVVDTPDEVLDAIKNAPQWSADSKHFAGV